MRTAAQWGAELWYDPTPPGLPMFVFLVSILGCSLFANVSGKWEGRCDQDGYKLDVELDIEEDLGGEVTGELTFSDPASSYSLEGDFEGERSDDEIEGAGEFSGSDGLTEVEFVAELDGDTLEGELTARSGEYSSTLDCELDRE